jgi:hypothetical protein
MTERTQIGFTVTDNKGHCTFDPYGLDFDPDDEENDEDVRLADTLSEKLDYYLCETLKGGGDYSQLQEVQATMRKEFPELILGEIMLGKQDFFFNEIPRRH